MNCQLSTVARRDYSTITAKPLLCKCWSCPECALMLKRKVIRRAIVGKPTKLLTLTANPKTSHSPEHAARSLKIALTVLVRRIRRRHPHSQIEYMAVFEKTQAGWPHLHVLLRAPYVPQRMISQLMKARTGAPIVDIRQVKSPETVARYVGKYLSKDPHKFDGCQRYWSSREWRTDHEDREQEAADRDGWHLVEMSLPLYASQLAYIGYLIEFDESTPNVRGFTATWYPPPAWKHF